MHKSNTVFLHDKELADVVVSSDGRGHNTIMSSLKYNRLVNERAAAHLFNKNTVTVRGNQLKDTVVVSDSAGNHTIKFMNETDASDGDQGNVFMNLLQRVQSVRNPGSIDGYLALKRNILQTKLGKATQLYLACNYTKALEYYSRALTMIESDSYPDEYRLEKGDIFRIKYALVLSNMGTNLYGPLKTACEMLATLTLSYGAEYPSLYYTLARAKVMLHLYESARIAVETGLAVLQECVVLSHLTFPASSEVIPDTEPGALLDNLEKFLHQSKNVPRADVNCCYRLCIADSKAMYFNGPNFIGYVNVTCSERCQYNYHRSCWKIKLKTDRVKKPSSILNQPCETDACAGVVSEIKIFDQRLKVNAAIKAKTGRDASPTDQDSNASSDNCVLESRVYKGHFELPTALSSNLKANAAVFTPGKLQNITVHMKNVTKSGPAVFESADTADQAVTSDGSVNRSRLKVDVPEFRPGGRTQSVTHVNLAKWSTNAECTLEVVPDRASSAEQPVLEAVPSDLETPSSFPTVPGEFSEVTEQPEDHSATIKLTEDKVVWTEPVRTHAVSTQCQVSTGSQQTQTEADTSDNNELALLKCQVNNLKHALCRAEDVNNQLLLSRLPSDSRNITVDDAATQTENIIDKRQKNCLKWIHNTCTPAICHADILHTSNQTLEVELKELKRQSRQEKDSVQACKAKYRNESDALRGTITELHSQLAAVQAEFHDYKRNNTMLSVNKMLLEQIQCNKNFYLPYLKSFEDKCKHMIWELEDLQVLTTADGAPSRAEVEESLRLWRCALEDVESRQRIVLQHYETLLYNITRQHYTAVFQYPGLSLLTEPPNIMLRHFKPLLIVNRRLDQDIANQMQSFYKILSQSYTNVYPQQLAGVELKHNIALAAQPAEISGGSAGDGQACSAPVPKAKGGEKTSLAPPVTAPASTTTPGPAPKSNKTRQNRPAPEPEPPQPTPTRRPLQDIIGLDALIDKLQSQFPLVDGSVITEALFSVRGQHGGLSGMSSKEILAEVKKYLRVKQQKCSSTAAPPVVNPWHTINTPVQWHSEEQSTSCTICFEKMAQNDSVMLRCQHVFHSTCIKIWLHSNSICPICRSFTTLDDEFPPLK